MPIGLLQQTSIPSFPFTLSTVSPFSLLFLDCPEHSRNLANNTGQAESIMGIKSFNLWRNQIRKREKIDLNQSLIYIHPFPLHLNQFVLFAHLQLSSRKKKNYSEVDKILEGIFHLLDTPPPSRSYAYGPEDKGSSSSQMWPLHSNLDSDTFQKSKILWIPLENFTVRYPAQNLVARCSV